VRKKIIKPMGFVKFTLEFIILTTSIEVVLIRRLFEFCSSRSFLSSHRGRIPEMTAACPQQKVL
jgi:hypothetical protein